MAAAAKGKTNWFAVVIATIVIVALVGVGALVIWLNNQSKAPGVPPIAANINTDTGAISFGDGPVAVGVYLDFMCPFCGDFEEAYGLALANAANDGDITLEMHPIAIQDNLSQGTQFSSRSASALYCVAEHAPEATLPFQERVFLNQPRQGSSGLTDDDLIKLAGQVGADAATDCITEGSYIDFVADRTPETPRNADGGIATPTITIDGERVDSSVLAGRLDALLN